MKVVGKVLLLISIFISSLAACALPQTQAPATDNPQSTIPTENSSVPATETLASTPRDYDEYEIITLLPRDAIPAIDNPEFLTSSEADEEYASEELILGVEFNGEARAYSVPFLSRHEIVNDTVGGVKIAVTW